jgi:hypothetical protein
MCVVKPDDMAVLCMAPLQPNAGDWGKTRPWYLKEPSLISHFALLGITIAATHE